MKLTPEVNFNNILGNFTRNLDHLITKESITHKLTLGCQHILHLILATFEISNLAPSFRDRIGDVVR